jgi:hypothetical protein
VRWVRWMVQVAVAVAVAIQKHVHAHVRAPGELAAHELDSVTYAGARTTGGVFAFPKGAQLVVQGGVPTFSNSR